MRRSRDAEGDGLRDPPERDADERAPEAGLIDPREADCLEPLPRDADGDEPLPRDADCREPPLPERWLEPEREAEEPERPERDPD